MVRIYPKLFVFPSILITAFLFLFLSTIINNSAVERIIFGMDNDLANQEMVVSKEKLGDKYPQSIQKWKDEIEDSADRFELDPNLIGAVMLQESGGQPSVISRSGAVGLMQIMPRDGIASSFNCGNNPCFINRPSTDELLDPVYNIEFGTRLLSDLIITIGSTRDALKAYGPMDAAYYYADTVLSIYSSYK